MRVWTLVVAVGCVEEPGNEPTDEAGTDTPTSQDTDTDPDTTDTDTDVPPPPPPECDQLAGLEVVSLVASAGTPDTLVQLDVTLSSSATVAGACVADEEPDQIFFAESTVAAETHTLRLSGLFPNASYTCTVAPTCPRMIGPPASTTWQTLIPPLNLRPLEVEIDPTLGMTGVWTLAPYALSLFEEEEWIVIWGPDGRVRWWMQLPTSLRMSVEALYHTDDDKLVWGGGFGAEGRIRIHDLWDGEQYAWAPDGWESLTFHHDAKRIADGRLMTLETRQNTFDGDSWAGFRIRVHHPDTGIVDFDFNSQSYVDQGIFLPPAVDLEQPQKDDPYHANWMDWYETAEGPRVYVSLCWTEQILSMNAVTQELDWLLGEGLGWTVLDETGAVMDEGELPDCQHGLEVIGDDHLLVYDNGIDELQSKAQEWLVDADAKTAQRLWNWTEAGWRQWSMGDIDDLGNGRVLVTQAPTSIVEVDKVTGLVASRMDLTGGGDTYRAERYQGCDFFTSVKDCPDLATRYAAVEPLLGP